MIRLFRRYYPLRNILFVIGEGLLMFSAVVASSYFFDDMAHDLPSGIVFTGYAVITLIFQICLYYNSLYNVNALKNTRELMGRLVQSLGGAAVILSGIHMLLDHEIISNKVFFSSIVAIVALVMTWRFLYSVILKRHMFDHTALLVGKSLLIRSIIEEVKLRKDSGYTLIHALSGIEPLTGPNTDGTITVRTCGEHYCGLFDLSRSLGIRLIIADKELEGCSGRLEEELLKCRVNGVRVLDANSFYEMLTGKLHVGQLNPCWLIFSEGFTRSKWHYAAKLAVDYTMSFILLVLLLPVILLTAALIKLESGGPVFYSQERLGKGRKPYKMYKFRSMVTDAEKHTGPQWSVQGDSRVTRVGKFIRNYRIDEIPQLWNVLKGDMSFVGPRPEREFFVDQLEKTIPFYSIRSTVKPGITGWAQVNFGYGATEDDALEKLNYDLYYIKNSSVFMDLFIIFKTTKTVIIGVEAGGASAAGHYQAIRSTTGSNSKEAVR